MSLFHIQPSEFWRMDVDDLKFWYEQGAWIVEQRDGR